MRWRTAHNNRNRKHRQSRRSPRETLWMLDEVHRWRHHEQNKSYYADWMREYQQIMPEVTPIRVHRLKSIPHPTVELIEAGDLPEFKIYPYQLEILKRIEER